MRTGYIFAVAVVCGIINLWYNKFIMNDKKKIILWLILMLGLIIILSLIYYGRIIRLKEDRRRAEREAALEQGAVFKKTNPLGIEIPAEVYYYTGTIKKKTGGSLTISAAAADNFLVADQEFIARIDENTRMLKYKMPIYLKPGESPKDYAVGDGKTTLADFKVGDRVTVYASLNIKDKSEFMASEIRAVEYK